MQQQKKFRATVIVETHNGILLARTGRGLLMLPGGGVDAGEQPISAAIRELKEETELESISAVFLFAHESAHYLHQVFHISAVGAAKASQEITEIACYHDGLRRSLSRSSAEIIDKFLRHKCSPVTIAS